MYATFTQITPAIHLRRKRLLPVAGVVMVRQGQKVNSESILAEASVSTHHVLIDVVKTFGLPGPKAAEPLIQRKVGENLGEHDIIAETGGLFSQVIRTPAPGKIISIHDGQVLIQTEAKKISLQANYSGTIVEVIPDRGAIIETTGVLIQGAWGNGKSAAGPLLFKSEARTSPFTSSGIEIMGRGSIIAAALCNDAELLDLAKELPVAGLILGTMPASLREKALAMPYPILLIDGFGQTGLNSAAFKALSLYNNSEVTLNTFFGSDSSISRPEVVITVRLSNVVPATQPRVTAGQVVRIHSAPFLSQIGTIEKILPGLTALPNGLRVCAASVIMENKERKTIPIYNLDVIGFTQ